jgi:uncharacterized membrane protein
MSRPPSQRRTSTERRLANFLGWFSFSLGAPQLIVPGLVNRLIGVRNDPESRFWQRVVGVREIAAWAGILSRPRPAGWLWARVAGDIKDLTLLGAAFRNRCEDPRRLTAATASVVGVTALDVYTAVRMSRADPAISEEEQEMRVQAAITVKRPLADVYGAWQSIENLPTFMEHLQSVRADADGRSHWKAKGPAGRTLEWDAETIAAIPNELIQWRSVEGSPVRTSGAVRFTPAPGGRGTEVHLRMEYEPPGGQLGETVAKLLGEDPVQQVKDDLRRFKQVMEVGEIIRSESTPEGAGGRRYIRQRPAQPVEEAELAAAGGRTS